MTLHDLTKIYYALQLAFKPKIAEKLFQKLINFVSVKK